MDYKFKKVKTAAQSLKNPKRLKKDGLSILKAPELKSLYLEIPKQTGSDRAAFGKEVNILKDELKTLADQALSTDETISPIDVSAPFDINTSSDKRPRLLSNDEGSKHPLMTELEVVREIFQDMGFVSIETRQIDDEYHMFDSLNFPTGHPARDDYDTFITKEGLVAPAHASIMQNRNLKKYRSNLDKGQPISVVYSGRSFRNEDVDARHDHTFYQVEIMYVDKNIHTGNLIATFKTFLERYYSQSIDVKTQPFYFPFTEPSFELALSCPFCKKKGCNICSYSGWIELLGMGMIHPNVLKMGGVDPSVYTGFAGGLGLERLVMMKYGIEDIRHFESAKLEFLRQFR